MIHENDIHPHKLNRMNPFLETYTRRSIPDESTLRKYYIKQVNKRYMNRIREEIGDNFICVSMDETQDRLKRKVTNVMIGPMYEDKPGPMFLVDVTICSHVNGITSKQMCQSAIEKVFGGEIDPNRLLLFVSDSAPYMIKGEDILAIRIL